MSGDASIADAGILAEMYGLDAAQARIYNKLEGLVDEALEQFDKGYAVDVERQMAGLARELSHHAPVCSNCEAETLECSACGARIET